MFIILITPNCGLQFVRSFYRFVLCSLCLRPINVLRGLPCCLLQTLLPLALVFAASWLTAVSQVTWGESLRGGAIWLMIRFRPESPPLVWKSPLLISSSLNMISNCSRKFRCLKRFHMPFCQAVLGKLSIAVSYQMQNTLREARAEPFFMLCTMLFVHPRPLVVRCCFLWITCLYALDVAEVVRVRKILFLF